MLPHRAAEEVRSGKHDAALKKYLIENQHQRNKKLMAKKGELNAPFFTRSRLSPSPPMFIDREFFLPSSSSVTCFHTLSSSSYISWYSSSETDENRTVGVDQVLWASAIYILSGIIFPFADNWDPFKGQELGCPFSILPRVFNA